MINRTNRLLISCLLTGAMIFGISSCKKTNYNKLTAEELGWLVYDQGQVINFKNQGSTFRRIKCTLKTRGYTTEGETYNEFSETYMKQLDNNTVNNPAEITGKIRVEQDDTGFSVYFTWPHFKPKNVELTGLKSYTKTIHGVTYNDVKIIDAGPLVNSSYYYQTIWYSKRAGVLRMYDIYNGIWTIYPF